MNPVKGIALKLSATLVFAFMGVLVKWVADSVPTGQIVFCRSFFGMLPILAVMAWRGDLPDQLWTARPLAHAGRVALGIGGMFLGFAALALIPLPDATAIGFAMPIFAVIFAALILKEVVRVYRWTAVFVGLIGVLVILSPHLLAERGADNADMVLGSLLALTGAIIGALAMITVRVLTRTERTGTIVFHFHFGGAVLGLVSWIVGAGLLQGEWRERLMFVLPDALTIAALVAIGLLGGVAQILLTSSYRHADASVIAPFEYTALLWAILLGFLVFGDVPTMLTLIGAAIVIAAGLFVIFRERSLGLERAREREAGK